MTYHKTVNLSPKTQIGLPFSKSYKKPTPWFWRVLGDILSGLGTLFVIIGISTNPIAFKIAAGAGWLGKIITNGISYKD